MADVAHSCLEFGQSRNRLEVRIEVVQRVAKIGVQHHLLKLSHCQGQLEVRDSKSGADAELFVLKGVVQDFDVVLQLIVNEGVF